MELSLDIESFICVDGIALTWAKVIVEIIL